jgi:hypothetical protein
VSALKTLLPSWTVGENAGSYSVQTSFLWCALPGVLDICLVCGSRREMKHNKTNSMVSVRKRNTRLSDRHWSVNFSAHFALKLRLILLLL